jgi:hypothetical protein
LIRYVQKPVKFELFMNVRVVFLYPAKFEMVPWSLREARNHRPTPKQVEDHRKVKTAERFGTAIRGQVNRALRAKLPKGWT